MFEYLLLVLKIHFIITSLCPTAWTYIFQTNQKIKKEKEIISIHNKKNKKEENERKKERMNEIEKKETKTNNNKKKKRKEN